MSAKNTVHEQAADVLLLDQDLLGLKKRILSSGVSRETLSRMVILARVDTSRNKTDPGNG